MKNNEEPATIQREFYALLADIEHLMKESETLTAKQYTDAKAKLEDKIATAKESIVDVGGDIAGHAQKTATRANHKLHEEPWTAVGVAVVAGLLAGMLFARR